MIRKRSNGSWRVELYDPLVGRKVSIKPRDYGVDTPTTAKSARILEHRALEQIAMRTGPVGKRDETCSDFAARWTEDFPKNRFGKLRREQTKKQSRERVSLFVEEFGERTLRSITRAEAKRWSRQNEQRVAMVCALFFDALEDELVESNPFQGLRPARKSQGRKNIVVLTEGEIERLCDIAMEVHGEVFGIEVAALITWAAHTAMRPSEIYAARYSLLDGDVYYVEEQFNQTLRVWTLPKNDSVGKVYVPREAQDAVLGKPRILGDDLMFHSKRGRPLNQTAMSIMWNPVRRQFLAELAPNHRMRALMVREPNYNLDFYELRHFAASQMLNDLQVPSWMISKQMRHEDPELIHEVYGHPDDDVAIAAIREAYQARRLKRRAPAIREATL